MSVAVAQAASATHTMAGERGVQARHGQFRIMCSSATPGPRLQPSLVACQKQHAPGGPRCTERGALAQAQVEAAQEVCAVLVQFSESVDIFTDTFLPIADIPVDSTTRATRKLHGAREGERVGVAPNQ